MVVRRSIVNKEKITKRVRFIICIMYRNFSLVSVETTHQIKVGAPIKIGQIVAKNLFGKKIDLVATRKIDIKN